MYRNRLEMYQQLESEFNSNVLVYVTSDRSNMEASIAQDAIDRIINQLDRIGICGKISLYLYTRGGDTAVAWNIINLLRMFCDELQVIVPNKAHSAGTIISLGANEILMTKQATLSPIDPSILTPLNPQFNNGTSLYPVSVEAIKGYLEFAKEELHITDQNALADIYMKLTDHIHPLVLGQAYRSRAQIKRIGKKLLQNQVTDEQQVDKIIEFLSSESGSHDYTINRREAKEDLGLTIRKPDDKQYKIINDIFINIYEELQLSHAFDPSEINGEYSARRCLLESIKGGCDYFITEGRCVQNVDEQGQKVIHNIVTYNGWRHEANSILNQNIIEEGGELSYEGTDEFQV